MLMKLRSKMQNQKGFTLVELMVVVVIIGVLVAIAVPIYRNVTDSAEENSCFANQRTIEGAASMHYAETGAWPSDVDELVSDGYLQAAPTCPKNGSGYTLNTSGKVSGCSDHGHY